MSRKPAVTRCTFPHPINTTHGPGYLIGCDPQRHLVCVAYTRAECLDTDMLKRYTGDNWTVMLDEYEIISDE